MYRLKTPKKKCVYSRVPLITKLSTENKTVYEISAFEISGFGKFLACGCVDLVGRGA
jgi:hypothetical protein